MSREALVLLVCCCDFRDGAERLIPSKSLRNAVIRAFPGLLCILRMCAPRRAAAVVRPRGREKSADRRRRILISRLLIIRASVPRRKSPFPAYFKGFPAVSPLIPPYPAFLKYPVSPHTRSSRKKSTNNLRDTDNAKERYQELVNLVRFGKSKMSIFTEQDYYEGVIDPENGADWNQTSPIDTKPTVEDFKKTVSDYLAWEVSTLLKNQPSENERLGK